VKQLGIKQLAKEEEVKRREAKAKKEAPNMLVSQICHGRTKLSLGTEAGDGLNFYQLRVEKDEKIETIKKLAKLEKLKPEVY
jgi:hypothetical protein